MSTLINSCDKHRHNSVE